MSNGLDRGANVYRWEIKEGNIKIAVAVMNDGKIVLKLELPNTMEIVSVKGDYYEVIHSPIPVGKCPQMVLRVFETEHARRAREKSGQLRLDEPVKAPTYKEAMDKLGMPYAPGTPGATAQDVYAKPGTYALEPFPPHHTEMVVCDRCNQRKQGRTCGKCTCDLCEACFDCRDHQDGCFP